MMILIDVIYLSSKLLISNHINVVIALLSDCQGMGKLRLYFTAVFAERSVVA